MHSETALYRHFSEVGELLYVGISSNVAGRLAQHARRSGWARRIARVDVEYYEDRDKAEKAEVEAIRKEKPLWNILHNTPSTQKKPSTHDIKACPCKTASIAQEVDAVTQELHRFHALIRCRLVDADDGLGGSTRFYFAAPLPALILKELSDFMDNGAIKALGFVLVNGVDAGCSDSGYGFLSLSTPLALRACCSGKKAVQDDSKQLATALDKYEQAFQAFVNTCS